MERGRRLDAEQASTVENNGRKRRKVALACEACRGRKIKCDGQIPVCGPCERRHSHLSQCLYNSENARNTATTKYIDNLHERIRDLETAHRGDGAPASMRNSVPPASHDQADMPSASPERQCGDSFSPSHGYNPVQVSQPPANQNTAPDVVGSTWANQQHQMNSLSHLHFSAVAIPAPESGGSNQAILHSGLRFNDSQRLPSENANQQPVANELSVNGDNTTTPREVSSLQAQKSCATSPELIQDTSSVISFMQLIRETRKHSNGSSKTLRADSKAASVPTTRSNDLSDLFRSNAATSVDDYSLPPRILADHLLTSYWTRVHCLYPFVHKSSFTSFYNSLWAPAPENQSSQTKTLLDVGLGGADHSTAVFYCALNAIFALGCEFADITAAERSMLSDTLFRRCKNLLHVDILDGGNQAMVQTLLLVSLYLHGTQSPNRCWNVVGLACRMARGLGMSMKSSSGDMSVVEVEVRRRTWHGCVMLDIAVSMNLGHPPMRRDEWDVPLPLEIDDEDLEAVAQSSPSSPASTFSSISFYSNALRLCEILRDILENIDSNSSPGRVSEKCTSLDVVIKIDAAMSGFEQSLPPQLNWTRQNAVETTALAERQANVLHARFLHLKILLYRPICHQLCREFSSGSDTDQSSPFKRNGRKDASTNLLSSSFSINCAVACVKAAQDLITLISFTSQTKETGAWWYNVFCEYVYLDGDYCLHEEDVFTSAIVVIVAESYMPVLPDISQQSLEASWNRCHETLDRMSLQYASARKCAMALHMMRRQTTAANSDDAEAGAATPAPPPAPANMLPITLADSTTMPASYAPSLPDSVEPSTLNDFQFDNAQVKNFLWQGSSLLPPWNVEYTPWWNFGPIDARNQYTVYPPSHR